MSVYSKGYYERNRERILSEAAARLREKRIAQFGSEQAWRSALREANVAKLLSAKPPTLVKLEGKCLALAASHPVVLDFLIRCLGLYEEERREKNRAFMREYSRRPQARAKLKKRLEEKTGTILFVEPAKWPSVVWSRFLDAVISEGEKEINYEVRKAERERRRQLLASMTPEERKQYLKKQRRLWKRRPQNRVVERLRERLRMLVARTGSAKAGPTLKLVGCSALELQQHLEAKFRDGMTWENRGSFWHVDHIRPCASFDLSDPAQQAQCFHWSNLQPLTAEENIAKGASYQHG